MSGPAENLATARRYLQAIESAAGADAVAEFFAPEVIVEIFPSIYFPKGSRSDLSGIRISHERGKKVMTSQR